MKIRLFCKDSPIKGVSKNIVDEIFPKIKSEKSKNSKKLKSQISEAFDEISEKKLSKILKICDKTLSDFEEFEEFIQKIVPDVKKSWIKALFLEYDEEVYLKELVNDCTGKSVQKWKKKAKLGDESDSEDKESESGSDSSKIKATRYAKEIYIRIVKKAKHKGIKNVKKIFKSTKQYDKIENVKEDLKEIGIKTTGSDVSCVFSS